MQSGKLTEITLRKRVPAQVQGFISKLDHGFISKLIPGFVPILAFLLLISSGFNNLDAQYKEKNYGNTPTELVPYARYNEAYVNFFDDPQPFTGPGREKKEPTGLSEVRIGFLGPLEGSVLVPQGIQMLNGSSLAIEEANAKGGYKGIPFKLMKHNDVGLWGAAANEVVKMGDEGCWAFLGTIDDINAHVALRIALKIEIPMVNTGDPDPTLTETRIPWLIRVISDDRQSSYALANYIHMEKKLDKVAVLRANNRYGRVGIMEFRDAAHRMGHPLVLEVRYQDGETSFTTQLERIKNAEPDAVVLWGNAKETALILQQMREMGLDQPVFGCDRMTSPEFLEIAGDLAEGVVTTSQYLPDMGNPVYAKFVKNYKDRYNMEPDVFAAHAYDGMNILLDAINMAGLNRAKIRDLLCDLKTFQGYQGVTGEIILDASWNDIGDIWMSEVVNGKFRYFAPPEFDESLRRPQKGGARDL
jgi:ABC-type branched-subunit amino acid transport system substrate-binding protein